MCGDFFQGNVMDILEEEGMRWAQIQIVDPFGG